MNRLWPILALFLVAATTADESRQYRVAQSAFDDKLYDVAERQLQEFVDKFPQSERIDTAYFLLGQAQFQLGRYDAAARTFTDALAKWPDKRADGWLLWLGDTLSRQEKYAAAANRYTELIEKHSRSKSVPQALYGLAFAQFKQQDYPGTIETLERLAREGVRGDLASDADLLRGQLYLARGELGKAETILEAVARRAGNTQRVYYRAQLWLGELFLRRQQPPEALNRYGLITESFKARPNRPVDAQLAGEAFFGTGRTLWETNDFAGAAAAFQLALTTAPGETLRRAALLKLAEAFVRDGKVNEGVERLKEFLQTRAEDPLADDVQLAIGNLLFGKGDYPAALKEYGQLIRGFPQSPLLGSAYRQAGWCAWQLQQTGEALGYFQKALPLLKDAGVAAETLFKIADGQYALGQFAEAAESYRELIARHAKLPGLDRALYQLGETYRRLLKFVEAGQAFERVVKEHPAGEFAPPAQYNLGQLLARQGDEPGARAAFAIVVQKFPANVWARNAALAVGESFNREGQYEQAIAEFDKLAGNGLDTELAQQAFYSRGWCLAQTGKRDKTLVDFLEFMKARPSAPLAPEVQYWIADEYLRQRDYLKAQAQFQSLAETYPTSKLADAALYFAGRAAYARQDFKTATEIYGGFERKFPQSRWRCEARFGHGDAYCELGQFDVALLIFESLIKEFPDCAVTGEALGRKGDCQYTLTRYDDALATYRKALDAAKEPALRIQLLFKLGQTCEKSNKPDDAFQHYSAAILEATASPAANEPPERFWSCKAARAAAALRENGPQWQDAITMYGKLAGHCPDLKEMADDRIRKLRVQHPGSLFTP